jgi:hypothetical protein
LENPGRSTSILLKCQVARKKMSTNKWVDYIASGKVFLVTFRDIGDTPYTGHWTTDPMGTLKGGETYSVFYAQGQWTCTGFNQHTNAVGTWIYSGGDPRQNQIDLWGRIFTFDGRGNVIDIQFGRVGKLRRKK